MREVRLRAERRGSKRRNLDACVDERGLVISGGDRLSKRGVLSAEGDKRWTCTIASEHIPKVAALLGAPADADVLKVLKEHWTDAKSYELERRIRESGIPSKLSTWSG
jgi:hypothetical protein